MPKTSSVIILSNTELEKQFEYILSIIERHQLSAVTHVNAEILLTNWTIGEYISNQLQSAQWGNKVVSDLADYIKRHNPKLRGYSKRNLYNMVKFYDTYSQDRFHTLAQSLHVDEFVQLKP